MHQDDQGQFSTKSKIEPKSEGKTGVAVVVSIARWHDASYSFMTIGADLGQVQKIRRIPRTFVDRIVADACAGAEVDLEVYTAAWLAEHALAKPAASTAFPRDEAT